MVSFLFDSYIFSCPKYRIFVIEDLFIRIKISYVCIAVIQFKNWYFLLKLHSFFENHNSVKLCRSIWFHYNSKGRFTRYDFVSCDEPTTGLRHDLRLVCTSEKCRSILKHVLKRCGNRKSCRRPAVSLSQATLIVPCKSALTALKTKARLVWCCIKL